MCTVLDPAPRRSGRLEAASNWGLMTYARPVGSALAYGLSSVCRQGDLTGFTLTFLDPPWFALLCEVFCWMETAVSPCNAAWPAFGPWGRWSCDSTKGNGSGKAQVAEASP